MNKERVWSVNTLSKNIKEYGLDEGLRFHQELKANLEAAIDSGDLDSIKECSNDYIEFSEALVGYLINK